MPRVIQEPLFYEDVTYFRDAELREGIGKEQITLGIDAIRELADTKLRSALTELAVNGSIRDGMYQRVFANRDNTFRANRTIPATSLDI